MTYSDKLNKFEKGLFAWKCPRCEYLTSSIIYHYARYDYECPRCHTANLSQFWAVRKNTKKQTDKQVNRYKKGVKIK